MIQFFRQNNFFTTLMLIPYTFLVRMAAFYLHQPPDQVGMNGVLYNVFQQSFLPNVVISHIVINLIIAFSAILVNRLVIQHRLSRFQTLIPGLVFVILVSWLEVFLSFSALHVANFFFIIGLLSVFKYSKKSSTSLLVFDGMFYFSLASLFYSPYIVYQIAACIGFIFLGKFQARELLNAILGLVTPYFITFGMLYYFGGDAHLMEGFMISTSIFSWFAEVNYMQMIPLVLYVFLIVLSIFSYNVLIKNKNLLVNKKLNILYWFFLISFFTIMFIGEKNPVALLSLALPISILIGMVWERLKPSIIEEFCHFVIIGAILFLHFNTSFNIF